VIVDLEGLAEIQRGYGPVANGHSAEFWGGVAHGKRFVLQDPSSMITVAVNRPIYASWSPADAPPYSAETQVDYVHYRPAGYDLDRRCWIFTRSGRIFEDPKL